MIILDHKINSRGKLKMKTKEMLLNEFESKFNQVKDVEKTESNKWIHQYAIGFGTWVLNNKEKALKKYKISDFEALISQAAKLETNNKLEALKL
jgi:hypothetical protein